MKLQIAYDARPQVKALLAAAALSIILWYVPYAHFLSYPFQLFVTFIHEGGHALAAVLTGNSVRSLNVSLDTSGLTETLLPQGSFFSRMLISSAGYLGAISFGALLLFLVRLRVKARAVLLGSAVIIAGLTTFFGLLTPLWNVSLPGPFTLIAGIALTLSLLAAAKYASRPVASFLVSLLAVQCVLNALFNLSDLFTLSFDPNVKTDAMNMQELTGIPSIFWAVFWIAISFLILSLVMRAYAISRDRSAAQPDLPFEDSPLEV